MKSRRLPLLVCLTAGVAALGLALPVLGQQGPESLLPPGFGDPPPPSAQPASPKQESPSTNSSSSASRPKSRPSGSSSSSSSGSASSASSKEAAKAEGDEEETVLRYDVPPTSRRSMDQIGVLSQTSGGFAPDAYGNADGAFLKNVLRNTKGPLASRWGMIITRRLLASRTNTPDNVDGADLTAERGWLLLRMGDAQAARQLVQQVDTDRYSKRLYEVAMPIFLANGDLSGMCPMVDEGARETEAPTWRMAVSICSSLAGEQGRASSLLKQGRKNKTAKGIDLLLTEKAVGAGTNGRNAVAIKWDKVNSFNVWRSSDRVGTARTTLRYARTPCERLARAIADDFCCHENAGGAASCCFGCHFKSGDGRYLRHWPR
jgi:hypothetical protein